MSDPKPTLAEQIAALEAEREALFAARVPTDARLQELYDQRQALVEQQAALIDPNTEAGLAALWHAAWNEGIGSQVASQRLERYFRSFAPEIWQCGWRRLDDSDDVFPAPQVMLTRGQDVSALAVGLFALVRQLAAGRNVIYVSLFDHDLSRYASYGIDVEVETGRSVLHATSYGRSNDILTGSLTEVLARAARDHWYQREAGATETDEDEERD